MSNPIRGTTAIIGIGNTDRWDAPGRSAFDQLQEASIRALEDAGPGAEVALAHANGGVLSSQATAILGTAATI